LRYYADIDYWTHVNKTLDEYLGRGIIASHRATPVNVQEVTDIGAAPRARKPKPPSPSMAWVRELPVEKEQK